MVIMAAAGYGRVIDESRLARPGARWSPASLKPPDPGIRPPPGPRSCKTQSGSVLTPSGAAPIVPRNETFVVATP